jgi:hypothetical protein
VIDYIRERQNKDGGYSFAQGAESSAADTYYGVEVLKLLGARPARIAKTIRFLKSLQHKDGRFDSVNVAYYVVKTLSRLGAKPTRGLEDFLLSLERSVVSLTELKADIESPSELEQICLILKLLQLTGHRFYSQKTKDLILSLQNHDGSFGRYGYSRSGAICYALECLSLLSFDVKSLKSTLHWVRSCEIPSGGFKAAPDSFDPSTVIDDVYFNVKSLHILNEACRYPFQTLDLIARFQNRNGGFRRSIFLGISTFESTYYAIRAAWMILRQGLSYGEQRYYHY